MDNFSDSEVLALYNEGRAVPDLSGILSSDRMRHIYSQEDFSKLVLAQWSNVRQATAEEIHRQLDEQSSVMVAEAERVLEYRKLYPSNAFLTREQVKNICLRYNLVLAPDFMFAGEIPEKNRQEIDAFSVRKEHNVGAFEAPFAGFPLTCAGHAPDMLSKPWALAISSQAALYFPLGAQALLRWASYWMAGDYERYPLREALNPLFIVRDHRGVFHKFGWQSVHPIGLDTTTILMGGLHISLHFRLINCVTDNHCKMIVCPADMLHDNLSIGIADGWQVVFSPAPMVGPGGGTDPIVLEPVKGGYLVVSKWDSEAMLPEVAGQTN